MMYKKTKIVIIGMSYAREWDLLINDNVEIINKGINGDITDNMVRRFTEDVIELHPDYVIIWGFSNDIITGMRENIDNIIKNIRDNIQKMVNTSLQNKITPILATQITISYKKNLLELISFLLRILFKKNSYQYYTNSNIQIVNNWIREYAGEKGIFLLDLEPLLSNQWRFRKLKYTQRDGSHVTQSGYARLTEFAIPHIKNYILAQGKL